MSDCVCVCLCAWPWFPHGRSFTLNLRLHFCSMQRASPGIKDCFFEAKSKKVRCTGEVGEDCPGVVQACMMRWTGSHTAMNLPQGVSAAVRITRADLAPEMRTTLQERPSVPQTAAVVRDAQGATLCVLFVCSRWL